MKIIVACGSGVATSTVIASKVEDILKRNGLKGEIIQCSLSEVSNNLKGVALVVTSMGRLEAKDVPVIVALPYITGIGIEEIDKKIENVLRNHQNHQ